MESAKPQNHPTIPDMPQTKSNRLLTLPTQYPRLLHTIHDFYTLSTTSTHYPRLLHTTHIFHTPPTTYTHPAEVSPGLPMTAIHHPRLPHTTYELRLLHATYDFYTLPTTSTHHPRLLHVNYDFYTPPTTSTRHLRLLQPPPPHEFPGREMTRYCLEIDWECPVTSRCYARRFLSDDSFAAILTILFSFTCTTVLVGAQL